MAMAAGDLPSETLLALCNSLARGIDIALASNHVPSTASRLPSLVKQHACRNGWFHGADTDELLQLSNELLSSFSMNMSITTEVGNALNTISEIIPRFLPQMKLDRLIISFEAKPGYDVLMADFLIQKSMSPEEMMQLIVARNDDLETSSCLISPPSVSFLVNGKGVAGRTNVSLDSGPQFPTDITKMLKSGTNIVQAVGYFNGNYTIAIASMSKMTSIAPILKEYVQPVVTELVPDSEIIEGPSRISLNCPISFRRINTPVKGHLCKHHQCFDYGNFMEMNSRKPSWHCPCCNQPTSFMDLRIDHNIVKILRDVTVDITDVVIYPDGSWRAAVEYDGSADQLNKGTLAKQKENKISGEPDSIPNAVVDVVDLTMDGDDGGENFNFETEDGKHFQKFQGVPESSAEQPHTHLETGITEGVINQLGDDISTWSLASSANPSFVSATMLDAQRVETWASLVNSNILNPVITDATSTLCHEPTTSLPVNLLASTFQNVTQFGGSIISSETERQHANRQVVGDPINLIQTPASSSSQCRHSVLLDSGSDIANASHSASYRAVPSATAFPELNTNSGELEMQQITRTSHMVSPLPQLYSMAQNLDPFRDLNSAFQQAVRLARSMHAGSSFPPDHHRVGSDRDSLLSPSDHQSSHHQLLNLRRHETMSQFTNAPPYSCSPSLNSLNVPAGSLVNHQYPQLLAAQRTGQLTAPQSVQPFEHGPGSSLPIAFDTSRPMSSIEGVQVQNMVRGPLAVSMAEALPRLQSENNWRPTGRMRGSLTGSAYSSALNHYLVHPSQ